MDPVTHALVGAAVGYACGGRTLGRHAAGLGALAGLVPDLDNFISSESDPLIYVEYHRHFTHSLLFSFAGAWLPMVPWLMRPEFRSRWRLMWLCAWLAYLSHCLLDASTTWGTQLFWPFARTRVSWDVIAIVDPMFTLALGVVLAFAIVRQKHRAAIVGLGIALAYLAFGTLQHARASAVQRKAARQRQHSIERAQVMPTLANNIVWRSVYLTEGKIHSDRIRVGWFSRGRIREGTSLPLMTHEQLREAERAGNRAHRGFDRFLWFSDGWVARDPKEDSIIGDMRYSRSTEAFDPVWGIRFIPDQAAVEWVSRERDRKLNLSQLWAEIAGTDGRYGPVSTFDRGDKLEPASPSN